MSSEILSVLIQQEVITFFRESMKFSMQLMYSHLVRSLSLWVTFSADDFISSNEIGLVIMEALKGHVKFLKKFLYLLIRTYASPN